MTRTEGWVRDAGVDATLTVRVVPRSSRTAVSGVMGDGADAVLRVALASAPVDGKANAELVEFVADVLDVPRSLVEVVAGKRSKNKVIRVRGKNAGEVATAFARFLPDGLGDRSREKCTPKC